MNSQLTGITSEAASAIASTQIYDEKDFESEELNEQEIKLSIGRFVDKISTNKSSTHTFYTYAFEINSIIKDLVNFTIKDNVIHQQKRTEFHICGIDDKYNSKESIYKDEKCFEYKVATSKNRELLAILNFYNSLLNSSEYFFDKKEKCVYVKDEFDLYFMHIDDEKDKYGIRQGNTNALINIAQFVKIGEIETHIRRVVADVSKPVNVYDIYIHLMCTLYQLIKCINISKKNKRMLDDIINDLWIYNDNISINEFYNNVNVKLYQNTKDILGSLDYTSNRRDYTLYKLYPEPTYVYIDTEVVDKLLDLVMDELDIKVLNPHYVEKLEKEQAGPILRKNYLEYSESESDDEVPITSSDESINYRIHIREKINELIRTAKRSNDFYIGFEIKHSILLTKMQKKYFEYQDDIFEYNEEVVLNIKNCLSIPTVLGEPEIIIIRKKSAKFNKSIKLDEVIFYDGLYKALNHLAKLFTHLSETSKDNETNNETVISELYLKCERNGNDIVLKLNEYQRGLIGKNTDCIITGLIRQITSIGHNIYVRMYAGTPRTKIHEFEAMCVQRTRPRLFTCASLCKLRNVRTPLSNHGNVDQSIEDFHRAILGPYTFNGGLYGHQISFINDVLASIKHKQPFVKIYNAIVGSGKTTSVAALTHAIKSSALPQCSTLVNSHRETLSSLQAMPSSRSSVESSMEIGNMKVIYTTYEKAILREVWSNLYEC